MMFLCGVLNCMGLPGFVKTPFVPMRLSTTMPHTWDLKHSRMLPKYKTLSIVNGLQEMALPSRFTSCQHKALQMS